MINFIKKVRRKIKEGMLQEMYREGKWIYPYVLRYKWNVVYYIILVMQ